MFQLTALLASADMHMHDTVSEFFATKWRGGCASELSQADIVYDYQLCI